MEEHAPTLLRLWNTKYPLKVTDLKPRQTISQAKLEDFYLQILMLWWQIHFSSSGKFVSTVALLEITLQVLIMLFYYEGVYVGCIIQMKGGPLGYQQGGSA